MNLKHTTEFPESKFSLTPVLHTKQKYHLHMFYNKQAKTQRVITGP